MHPLDQLKEIVKNQKTVRTTRLDRIVKGLSKTVIGLSKDNAELKRSYEKLHRDFRRCGILQIKGGK